MRRDETRREAMKMSPDNRPGTRQQFPKNTKLEETVFFSFWGPDRASSEGMRMLGVPGSERDAVSAGARQPLTRLEKLWMNECRLESEVQAMHCEKRGIESQYPGNTKPRNQVTSNLKCGNHR
ncbi:uncharacterized protein LOC116655138 [Drosophila ananassae]|uniref:uncharacterized protein LOC116655138 n=1 Tax=Drosophila ananassae TaxID=7217 RepID=UPI0013A5E825|nr:uncharacterized protein LOC116655138 [Drosophila ananassae]